MLPQDSCIIFNICIWIQNACTRDHYSPYFISNTKHYQLKNGIHTKGKEDKGSQFNARANMRMNKNILPQMWISIVQGQWVGNIFPVSRDTKGHPHKIKHMARDKR